MSKPTRGPEGSTAAGRSRRGGRWSPATGLAAGAGALVLVSLIAPTLGGGNGPSASAQPSATDGASASATPATSASSPPTASTAVTAVPKHGPGTLHVLAVPGADTAAPGRTVRYTVEAEDGVGVDEAEYARIVREVLTDQRGWETQDEVHFVNVSPEQAKAGDRVDVRITMATPDTVDDLCAPMDTEGQVSCRNGPRVALNAVRWTQGVPYYPDDLVHYRIYMVNHEVGHAIGHGHQPCPGPGQPAPVMLQQTLGLQGCTRYPWAVPGQPI